MRIYKNSVPVVVFFTLWQFTVNNHRLINLNNLLYSSSLSLNFSCSVFRKHEYVYILLKSRLIIPRVFLPHPEYCNPMDFVIFVVIMIFMQFWICVFPNINTRYKFIKASSLSLDCNNMSSNSSNCLIVPRGNIFQKATSNFFFEFVVVFGATPCEVFKNMRFMWSGFFWKSFRILLLT